MHLFCIGAAGLDVTNNSSAPPSWVYGGRRTTESDRQLAGVGVTRTLLSPFSLSRFTWYEYVIIRLWIKVSLVPRTGTWHPYLPPQWVTMANRRKRRHFSSRHGGNVITFLSPTLDTQDSEKDKPWSIQRLVQVVKKTINWRMDHAHNSTNG